MAPPQTNATLTAIAGAGAADDWDRPASAGASKWTGSIRAYYREKVDRVANGQGGVDVLVRRTLWVETADLPDELDTDDALTFRVDGDAADQIGTARTVARSRLPAAGVPSALQTTRMDLEDA